MSKLAPGLGLSDQGLRKICMRYSIPVPPRGHWAKLAAGYRCPTPPLPNPEDDSPVSEIAEALRRQLASPWAEPKAKATGPATPDEVPQIDGLDCTLRPTLDGCHSLALKTYGALREVQIRRLELQRQQAETRRRSGPRLEPFIYQGQVNGRDCTDQSGTIRVAVTLTNIEWIARYLDAVIRAVAAYGCWVKPTDKEGRCFSRVADQHAELELSFSEEMEKQPPELGHFSAVKYRGAGSFRLKVGKPGGTPKFWRGKPAELERMLPTTAREIAVQLKRQHRLELARDVEDKARRAVWAAEDHERRRQTARSEQLKRAETFAADLARYRFIASAIEHLRKGWPDDDVLKGWMEVVESDLHDPSHALLAKLHSEAEDGALWWPTAEA